MKPFALTLAGLGFAGAAMAAVPQAVELTSLITGLPEPILSENWQAVGEHSAPVDFRACFRTPLSLGLLTETFTVYDAAHPLAAPPEFGCYDARRIGADLATGVAIAFLSARDIAPGVDRVVAVYPDGRAFVWQQPSDLAGTE
ncbi:hypothetical protein C8J27_10435 [Rhodobacter aestuarii]|uniref:Histidine kinase n=1 Tax=Rhodobacter aestuarii TaxID=453582 RepID=A0A1N7L3N7_9RHOB|nr:DUF6446 family protein [Rhodobacter aestuarii]PTV95400.1 hypothetical protein C8J27_10435 [Rhodobacter aestuarii]SIS68433.1 hypothetical protein SAMN05421580_103219 [Rhodobacter aestuarii]